MLPYRTWRALLALLLPLPLLLVAAWYRATPASGITAPTRTVTPTDVPACALQPGLCIYLPIVRTDGQPDLTITSLTITLDTSCLGPTSRLGIRAGVANIGSADAGPFVVKVNGMQQTLSAGLAGGQTTTLWFPGYDTGTNTAIADATFLVTESNEANNVLSQQLPIPTPPLPCMPTPTGTPRPTTTPTVTTQPASGVTIGSIRYDPPDAPSEYVQASRSGYVKPG